MNIKIQINKTKLIIRTFTQNTLIGSMSASTDHRLRVMSTPTWPVPYYQRLFRHPYFGVII